MQISCDKKSKELNILSTDFVSLECKEQRISISTPHYKRLNIASQTESQVNFQTTSLISPPRSHSRHFSVTWGVILHLHAFLNMQLQKISSRVSGYSSYGHTRI